MLSPFDLHVLSTPPAFILSQDQTLTIIVCPASSLWHYCCFSEYILNSFFSKHGSFKALRFSLPSFGIFQGCITVCLSRNNRTYLALSRQRRRRDLNPRAAINDLLPFQGSPFSLLGISPYHFKSETVNYYILQPRFCQWFFQKTYLFCFQSFITSNPVHPDQSS